MAFKKTDQALLCITMGTNPIKHFTQAKHFWWGQLMIHKIGRNMSSNCKILFNHPLLEHVKIWQKFSR